MGLSRRRIPKSAATGSKVETARMLSDEDVVHDKRAENPPGSGGAEESDGLTHVAGAFFHPVGDGLRWLGYVPRHPETS